MKIGLLYKLKIIKIKIEKDSKLRMKFIMYNPLSWMYCLFMICFIFYDSLISYRNIKLWFSVLSGFVKGKYWENGIDFSGFGDMDSIEKMFLLKDRDFRW